jgi:hypothetical protein
MNYAEYLRRQSKSQSKIIGFKNGQDASAVTYKAQAIASSSTNFKPIATTHSKIGGSIANIGMTNLSIPSVKGEYEGVIDGLPNADRSAGVIGAALRCAVCSDAPSSEPYNIVVPCIPFLEPVKNSQPLKCVSDFSQLFRDNQENTRQQGLQLNLRNQYNLPNKLQGLRGPIVNRG